MNAEYEKITLSTIVTVYSVISSNLLFGCQPTIMAAALLSNKQLHKFIKNNIKFSKSFSSSQSFILNKSQLGIICQQCATTSYYRVKFYKKL